ncbi:MAG: hypothetical protein P8Y44_06315 [Acidobacteriota bacterium]
MKTRAIIWSLKLVAAAWAFAAAPVHAGLDSLILGQGFNVGGIEFRIGYGQRGHQPPTYYFATRSPLAENEAVCSRYCLLRTRSRHRLFWTPRSQVELPRLLEQLWRPAGTDLCGG